MSKHSDDKGRWLKEVSKCPVCQDEKRNLCGDTIEINSYVKTLIEWLDIPKSELASKISIFECTNCGSQYSDPWLTPEGATSFYSYVRQYHKGGWNRFYVWANNDKKEHLNEARARSIVGLLEKVLGHKLENYAEVNCPFYGLLPFFTRIDHPAKNRETLVREAFREIYKDIRRPDLEWVFERNPRSLIASVRRVTRGVRRRVIGCSQKMFDVRWVAERDRQSRKSSTGFVESVTMKNLELDRYLIVAPSTTHWTTNCVSLGSTCRGVASALFSAPSLPLCEVESRGMKFDVVGLFNVLDHFPDPLDLLDRVIRVSNFLFVDLHCDRYTFQHSFSLSANFTDYLKRKGYQVLSLSAADYSEHNPGLCFMIDCRQGDDGL